MEVYLPTLNYPVNPMIEIKPCNTVEDSLIYSTFMDGFSDYMMKVEMSESHFLTHFFGAEGNQRNFSFIAFLEDTPIGVVLGGIRKKDGLKTMRCGALCVSPKYRGSAAARKLMEKLEETAREEHCQRLFLEVIIGNDRAVKFYRKLGYREINQITYFILTGEQILNLNCKPLNPNYTIREIPLDMVQKIRAGWDGIAVNWQSDVEYFSHLNGSHIGVFDQETLIGFSSSYRGSIFLIWVDPAYRKQGLACHLLTQIHRISAAEQYRITVPGNKDLEGFCRHLKMAEMEIHQFEMEKRF